MVYIETHCIVYYKDKSDVKMCIFIVIHATEICIYICIFSFWEGAMNQGSSLKIILAEVFLTLLINIEMRL